MARVFFTSDLHFGHESLSKALRGMSAKALKIKGDAEAEYNRKIAASLSPLIIDQNMIDKWDGKLPVYGTTPTLFRDLGK